MNDQDITDKEIEDQIQIWKEFAEKNGEIKLNPDMERVKSLAKGVLNNESMRGLKFCPCRIRTKIREKDIKLICPCNFKAQTTWKEKGECWCSLFIRA